MRRNRKRRVQSRIMPVPVTIGIVALATIAAVYLIMDNKCSKYEKQIKELETANKKSDNDLIREETRFNSMKTPEKINDLLLRHGMQMDYARPEQVVRMGKINMDSQAIAAKQQAYRERESGIASARNSNRRARP